LIVVVGYNAAQLSYQLLLRFDAGIRTPHRTDEFILPGPAHQIRESGKSVSGGNESMTALPLAAGTYQFVLPRELIN